jgi:hypothetical protein
MTELNKLERKVILLNKVLNNVDIAQGDAYDVRRY